MLLPSPSAFPVHFFLPFTFSIQLDSRKEKRILAVRGRPGCWGILIVDQHVMFKLLPLTKSSLTTDGFQARSQNYEERLLASLCLCSSVVPRGTTRFPLYGFS
jgi:hypothetical protein